MTPEDIEKLDVDAVAESPAMRTMLSMFKALILQLFGLIEELKETLKSREDALKSRDDALKHRDTRITDLEQLLFGQKSERQKRSKRPPREPLDPAEAAQRLAAGERKREQNRKAKQSLPTEDVAHYTPSTCPGCGGAGPFDSLPPDESFEYEHVPARIVRRRHLRHKCVCGCGQILSGDAPDRVGDSSHYGPGMHANAVVSKCADAMPLNRLAKRYARAGVPMSRSTLTDIYHRSATLLSPIYDRMMSRLARAIYVNADETTQPLMDHEKCKQAYIWTFIGEGIIGYTFSPTRSGNTPLAVLGDSTGWLQIDGYTGYNTVLGPGQRRRAGCIAHARRYFFKAYETCPIESETVFAFIRRLYRVEKQAAKADILGTEEHHRLRQRNSKPVMEAWHEWLLGNQPLHPPKGPMGKAIAYTLNQWPSLEKYLDDPKLQLDNNVSERALRIIALGRDNFRWVGSEQSGKNLAILQTIVSTCMASNVNPYDYLVDVLIRVNTHPASAIDELLPMNWKPPDSSEAT